MQGPQGGGLLRRPLVPAGLAHGPASCRRLPPPRPPEKRAGRAAPRESRHSPVPRRTGGCRPEGPPHDWPPPTGGQPP
eukprot:11865576-Alexandrium_andersonii.AAC.1